MVENFNLKSAKEKFAQNGNDAKEATLLVGTIENFCSRNFLFVIFFFWKFLRIVAVAEQNFENKNFNVGFL